MIKHITQITVQVKLKQVDAYMIHLQKNIVVNPNVKCRIEMIITVDDMPESSQIESVRYKSDLGEFTLNKADK